MTIEDHLNRLGVVAPTMLQELEELLMYQYPVREFVFMDPRDPITQEVPF